jgi:hypothetical protein
MRLVPDWRESWKWLSMRFTALIIALPVAWMAVPDEVKAYLPDEWKPWIMVALGVCVFVGRVIDQTKGKAA